MVSLIPICTTPPGSSWSTNRPVRTAGRAPAIPTPCSTAHGPARRETALAVHHSIARRAAWLSSCASARRRACLQSAEASSARKLYSPSVMPLLIEPQTIDAALAYDDALRR
jgi:hypothetical protein